MENNISVSPATAEDKSTIENLIQLYLYDMTGDLPFPVGRDGKFEYDFLDRFWQHPYLVFQGNELAGFSLVVKGSPVTENPGRYFMAEFFILKAYRRQGAGKAAFKQLLQRHRGPWEIAVIDRNKDAYAFWAKMIGPYAANSFPHKFDGENWLIYVFESD